MKGFCWHLHVGSLAFFLQQPSLEGLINRLSAYFHSRDRNQVAVDKFWILNHIPFSIFPTDLMLVPQVNGLAKENKGISLLGEGMLRENGKKSRRFHGKESSPLEAIRELG